MHVRLKIYLTLIFAAIIGALFFYFSEHTKRLTETNLLFLKKVALLEKLELQLNEEILKNSFFLYQNYDKTRGLLQKIEAAHGELVGESKKMLDHKRTVRLLNDYEISYREKERDIQKFSTLNSIIKNSSNYIPLLVLQYTKENNDLSRGYLEDVLNITSSIFLIRSSHDKDVLVSINESVERIKGRKLTGNLLGFNKSFLAHVNIYQKYFVGYSQALERTLSRDTTAILDDVKISFIRGHEREVSRFTLTSLFFLLSFLAAIGFVVYFLINTDRENRKLLSLQKELKEGATKDYLTGLPNRFAYEQESIRFKKPLLLLMNIDGFKHINDFYGTKVGDHVLKQVGGGLKTFLKDIQGARVYRLGADDFGLMLENHDKLNVLEFTQEAIDEVEGLVIRYQNYDINVTVTVGISREEPFIEKADMVLKHAKAGARKKFLEYNEDLNLYEDIQNNLHYLSVLRGAIERDDIVPYFQPIYNNATGERAKYECLARIIDEHGNVLSPFVFLEAAKKSKHYAEITKIMILKSFIAFGASEHQFSINLSIEDIIDQEINDFIFEMLDNFEGIGERVIFEILESEGISNYEAVNEFIMRNKSEYGCKFALDDFGAGHSNFEHILKLDFDYLKIDASLIKNIDTDRNSQIIVETIVSLSRKIGNKKLTAEYVHSKAIYDKVKELGIEFSQGFYLGKPEAIIS